MPFGLRLHLEGEPCEIDVIDVMSLDRDGKIASLRAFWNPNEARRLGWAGIDARSQAARCVYE